MADAKALTDISQTYATWQNGDLFFAERAGVAGKTTYAEVLAMDHVWAGDNSYSGTETFTGTVDLTGATVTGLSARGTIQNTTSGTAFDFTSIPAWANEVTFMFNRVSLDGDGEYIGVQIGDSGGIETTGYFGRTESRDGTDGVTPTTAMPAANVQAANTLTGTMRLVNMGGNTWVATGLFSVAGVIWHMTSIKGLDTALDRVRIVRSGTANFDGGSVNVSWRA